MEGTWWSVNCQMLSPHLVTTPSLWQGKGQCPAQALTLVRMPPPPGGLRGRILRIQILAWKQDRVIPSPYTSKKPSATYPFHGTHGPLPTILRAGFRSPISAEDTGLKPPENKTGVN